MQPLKVLIGDRQLPAWFETWPIYGPKQCCTLPALLFWAIFGSTNPFCQIFSKRVGVTENVWRPKIGDSHPAQRRRARHGWRLTSGRCLSLHLVCSVQTRWGQNDAGGNGKMSGGGWGNCGCGWVIMGKTQFWEEKNVVSFRR